MRQSDSGVTRGCCSAQLINAFILDIMELGPLVLFVVEAGSGGRQGARCDARGEGESVLILLDVKHTIKQIHPDIPAPLDQYIVNSGIGVASSCLCFGYVHMLVCGNIG